MNNYLNNSLKNDVLTKFLSLEEQKQLQYSNRKYKLSNIGYERSRAYIFKEQVIDNIDFQITVLCITYNQKFYNITHPMVLGALMGLGITRDCIGDIIISDNIYVIVIAEMADFIINNLNFIDKASISITKIDKDVISNLDYNIYNEEKMIVSSLRLDVIVSKITNFSREKAKKYIELKQVKVNGDIIERIDYVVKIDDLISIHRFGRTILKEIVRKTKKDKFVLLVNKTK